MRPEPARRQNPLLRQWLLFGAGIGMALVYSGYILAWTRTSGTGEGSFAEIGVVLAFGMGLIVLCACRRETRLRLSHYASCLPLLLWLGMSFIAALAQGEGKFIAWLAFALLLFALMAHVDIARARLVEAFLVLGLIEAVAFLLFNREALFAYAGGRGRVSFDNPAYTLSAYAMSGGLLAAVYSFVHLGRARLMSLCVLALTVTIILGTGTRSVLAGVAVSVTVLLTLGGGMTAPGGLRRTFFTGGAVVAVMVIVPGLWARLSQTLELVVTGLGSLSGANALERSAEGRRYFREIGLQNIADHPWAGSGFMTRQLDFPLLQAAQDFGLFLGACFIIAALLLPGLWSLKALRHGRDAEKFIAALFILNSPRLFLHGTPYDWVTFTYLLPVYGMALCRPLPNPRPAARLPAFWPEPIDG
ncbi:MAG: O-antigen ligase family protein [Rhizobiales bacterium]|nr:O-antigen ligase family protein [Hyphomicrobiales bacterium]